MLKSIKRTIITVLATLGVLFIIIMLWPEDEKTEADSAAVETTESVELESEPEEKEPEEEAKSEEAEEEQEAEETEQVSGNVVTISIPESEVSSDALTFKAVTLDNQVVSQDIFADYDLTIIHVWGTYCGPCKAEMGDYAELYKELPDNVNLIAIVIDTYDGIDSNVDHAKTILSDAGAEFTNLRTSDDLYAVTSNLQYVPSSFFVDRQGHMVGAMLDGASFEDTKARLASYMK